MVSPSCHSNGEEAEMPEFPDQVHQRFSEPVRKLQPAAPPEPVLLRFEGVGVAVAASSGSFLPSRRPIKPAVLQHHVTFCRRRRLPSGTPTQRTPRPRRRRRSPPPRAPPLRSRIRKRRIQKGKLWMRSDPGRWSPMSQSPAPRGFKLEGGGVGGASHGKDEAVFIISNPAYVNGNI